MAKVRTTEQVISAALNSLSVLPAMVGFGVGSVVWGAGEGAFFTFLILHTVLSLLASGYLLPLVLKLYRGTVRSRELNDSQAVLRLRNGSLWLVLLSTLAGCAFSSIFWSPEWIMGFMSSGLIMRTNTMRIELVELWVELEQGPLPNL